MDTEKKELRTYTLTPEEIEKLLQAEYGSKLEPVNGAKLARQRQQREKHRAK